MFGLKKKQKACPIKDMNSNLKEHIDVVEECLGIAYKTLDSYLKQNLNEAKNYSKQVDKIESKADEIRRRISSCLFQGRLLPFLRKDFLQLINAIDEIANGAERVCDFCLAQRPEVPGFLHSHFLYIFEVTIKLFDLLKESLELLRGGDVSYGVDDSDKLSDLTKIVIQKESEIDELQWKVTREIFQSDISLSNKMHIENLLRRICELSNFMEDVVERIEIITVREAF